ncbi:MAG: Dihydrodipicolinate reductase, C-terminus, partial [Bacteroidota bacterium]
EALNRKGFAEGALQAAAWLRNRTGFYSIDDWMQSTF